MRGKDSSHASGFLHPSLIIHPAWRFLNRAAVGYATDDPEEFTTSNFMAKVRRAQESRNGLLPGSSQQ
jgi:hypothetical protein